jgi:hypothetical protein
MANSLLNFLNIQEQEVEKKLTRLGGVSTAWSLQETNENYENRSVHPGFFTPFNPRVVEKREEYVKGGLKSQYRPGAEDHISYTPGYKEAGLALGLSSLNLQTAAICACHAGTSFFNAMIHIVRGDLEGAQRGAGETVQGVCGAFYFLGSFVLNFVKELTALVTRSIATLVAMCRKDNNEALQVNPEPSGFGESHRGNHNTSHRQFERDDDHDASHEVHYTHNQSGMNTY